MIIPPELPDTTQLRKALAQYVAINDHNDEMGVSLVLFSLETFVLIRSSLGQWIGAPRGKVNLAKRIAPARSTGATFG